MPNAAFLTVAHEPSRAAAKIIGNGVKRVIKRVVKCWCLLMLLALCILPVRAQQSAVPSSAPPTSNGSAPQSVHDKLADLDKRVTAAQSSGDNAWMLVSAALVLMMTGPGLALFYGGLVRRKNVLGTMMHSFILMAVVTVLWAVIGYSLTFGGPATFVGNLDFAFLKNVG